MSFNSELNKQAQEFIFSRKILKSSHPLICFDNVLVSLVDFQKHLGIYLDEKLNFKYDIKENMKEIGVIKKLSKLLPQYFLITI